MYDSLNNLKRSLRKTYKGILWKLGLWTLLAVAVEVVCVDLASLFFQIAALGTIGQQLVIRAAWLGFTPGAAVPGLALLKVGALLLGSLVLRQCLGQRRDRQTERIAAAIAKELRTRLFRESHRTSGMLITPETADQTVALVQEASLKYGQARAIEYRDTFETTARVVAGVALAALVRWDWALILAVGTALLWLLNHRRDEAQKLAQEKLGHEGAEMRRNFKEELRESYQARSIGSELGHGRPSDRWIHQWSAHDQAGTGLLQKIHQTENWGRLAIFGLVILAIAMRTAGQPIPPGGLIALMSLSAAALTILNLNLKRYVEIETGLSWMGPLFQALTNSVRIWDMSDAVVMQPCRSNVRLEGVPLGLGPEDPRSQQQLTAEIPARKVTAIVCPDLLQRRKLMRLMARWEDPLQGRVLVDGLDLRNCTIASTRMQVGTIRSDAYVNTGTILENITLSDPRGDLLSAIAAAKDVHAHRLIQRMPAGYQTRIDAERPAEDSIYARFLIALARGRWHDPSILLVEEPSPGMTRGMRELLRDAYRRLARERTIVIFTRHAASVLAADHVILIGPRRVVQGAPKTLIRTSPPFRRAMLQMGLGLKPKQASRPGKAAKTVGKQAGGQA